MANLEVLALDEATPQIRAPGSGDGYTMPRPVVMNPGTLTTDIKVLDLAATWNSSGVTFTGVKLNVTDTASAAASLLLDLEIGGVSKFYVDKTGKLTVAAGSSTAPSIMIAGGGGNSGFGSANGYDYFYTRAGSPYAYFGFERFDLGSAGKYTWSSGASAGGTADLLLLRDAAAILAQRNSTNAQTSRLYRTYTDASNYQRLTKTWSTSTALIHNEGAGTGADGSIAFNDAALATDATKGFIMIPSCAGAPTGTPADIPTGQIPIVFDSTNNKIYVYDGGWIATAALT